MKKDFSFVSPHFPAAVFFCLSPPTLSRAPQPGGFHLKISSFKSQFPLFSVKYDSQRKTLSAVNHRRTCSFNLKFSLSNFPSLLSPVVSSSRETNSGLVSRCDVAGSSPSSRLTCWRGTDGILQQICQKSFSNVQRCPPAVGFLSVAAALFSPRAHLDWRSGGCFGPTKIMWMTQLAQMMTWMMMTSWQ